MAAEKKKPRGRPFAGREDPRLRQNIRAAQAAPEGPDGAEQGEATDDVLLYLDMRHVYTRPKVTDRTEGQRNCRKWFAEDIKAFMTKLADLEKVALAKESEEQAKQDGRDEGTERVEELIEALLQEASES